MLSLLINAKENRGLITGNANTYAILRLQHYLIRGSNNFGTYNTNYGVLIKIKIN
jgi:hypothetical protein